MSLRVELASSADRQVWDRYVTARANAGMYHLYGWRDVFREAFRCQSRYLIARAETGVNGVLPLIAVRTSLPGGNYVSSLPGGICAKDEISAQELIQAAIQLVKGLGARYLMLRDGLQEWEDDRLETRIEYRFVVCDLPSDPQVMWGRLGRRVRKSVRRARSKGLVAVWSNDNLEGFYHVHAISMRDMGTPALPKRFFKGALERFPSNARVLTVHLEDKVIGSHFLFGFKGLLSCPFGSSIRRYFRLCPNDLAEWEIIRYACQHGYHTVDLGRSRPGSGHAAYKKKYLAKPQEVFYQYFLHTARAVPASRGGAVYRTVRRVWRHLPLPVANALSPVVRRVIPLG